MTDLTADLLLERFFWPHYPPDVRADPNRFRDLDANPGSNPALYAQLADAAELFVRNAPRLLAARAQPGGAPAELALPFTAEGVARLARALDRPTRDALIAASDPRDPSNPFFNAVVHAAAYVGEVVVRAHGGRWSMRRPAWESVVLRPPPPEARAPGGNGGASPSPSPPPRASGAVPPFHWLLKHLSDQEIDRASLAYRFHVHVELATRDLAALPAIAPPRPLPMLKAPTYALLVAYLQKHLPALRDLGPAFPSPAEFTDRGYPSVGFALFHGGRVLALHGQAPPRGEQPALVEVHWLTAAGYDHTDAIPCDAQPPYFARATGEALEVTVAWQQRPHTHTITFRGHGR